MQQEDHPSSEKKARRANSDVGTVTVHFRPTPDAQERLRRVFALILSRALTVESTSAQGGETHRGEVVDDD